MNWILLISIAVLTDALRIFTDNYISDVYFKETGAVSQKFFYGFAYILISLVTFIVIGFNPFQAELMPVGLILLSGVLVSLAGIPYYRALEIEDSTNIGIFIQLAPILYLVFGWFFLDESFSPIQLAAFVVILAAPALAILTTRKRSRKVKLKAVFYAFTYVLIAVIGNLFFVKADASSLSFVEEIALLFLAKGITDVVTIYVKPKWRKRFKNVFRANRRKIIRPLLAHTLFAAATDFTYRNALVVAPAVALASATTDSATPIVIFFMGLLLTIVWPKFGREKLNRKTVIVHFIATILVVTGIILIQI